MSESKGKILLVILAALLLLFGGGTARHIFCTSTSWNREIPSLLPIYGRR